MVDTARRNALPAFRQSSGKASDGTHRRSRSQPAPLARTPKAIDSMATPTIVEDTSLSTPAAAWQLEKAARRVLRQSSNEIGELGSAFFGGAQALRTKTGVDSSGTAPFGGVVHPGSSPTLDLTPVPSAFPLIDAEHAINAKAAALGWAGAPTADVDAAGAGFLRSFVNADIYFSPQTGAHEVHGAIRDKYNALGGAAGPLGLPLTDETGTPDGEG